MLPVQRRIPSHSVQATVGLCPDGRKFSVQNPSPLAARFPQLRCCCPRLFSRRKPTQVPQRFRPRSPRLNPRQSLSTSAARLLDSPRFRPSVRMRARFAIDSFFVPRRSMRMAVIENGSSSRRPAQEIHSCRAIAPHHHLLMEISPCSVSCLLKFLAPTTSA